MFFKGFLMFSEVFSSEFFLKVGLKPLVAGFLKPLVGWHVKCSKSLVV